MSIFLIILFSIIVLLTIFSFFLLSYTLSRAYFDRHQEKQAYDEDGIILSSAEEMQKLVKTSEEVSITSYDNLKLVGYLRKAKSPTHNYIIAMHGYHGKPAEMAHFAYHFQNKHNFNILVPTQRAHGKSEGKFITMGFKEKFDLKNWIDFIIKEDKKANILLFGISMGAATVTQVSNLKLPSNVKAIIADCGYTSCFEEFKYELKHLFHLPSFPLLNFTSFICRLRLGFFFQSANSLKAVKESKIPTLFIHGDKDTFVPFRMQEELFSQANCPKEKCIIKDATHAMSESKDPQTYWKVADAFTLKYFICNK